MSEREHITVLVERLEGRPLPSQLLEHPQHQELVLCLHADIQLGLPTPADEIPGDFFESLEIPGDFRFLLYKRAFKNKFIFLCLFLLFSLI